MYKIGEKGFSFFQWGGGRASWIYKSLLDWTGLLIFPLYHVSSCFLVLPILQASLKLTLKMVETNTQSSSLEVDPDTDMKANVDFMRTNSYIKAWALIPSTHCGGIQATSRLGRAVWQDLCGELSRFCLLSTCCWIPLWESKGPPDSSHEGFPSVWELFLLHDSLHRVLVPISKSFVSFFIFILCCISFLS